MEVKNVDKVNNIRYSIMFSKIKTIQKCVDVAFIVFWSKSTWGFNECENSYKYWMWGYEMVGIYFQVLIEATNNNNKKETEK